MDANDRPMYTAVRLPRDVRKRVHLLAAERGESISEAAVYLIRTGLDAEAAQTARKPGDGSVQARELRDSLAEGRR